MTNKLIYIVYSISAGTRNEEEKHNNYEILKLKYNKPQMTFEQYEKMQKSWNDFDYYANAEPMGYYTDLQTAHEGVINNVCDFNECGSYPYAAIVPTPVDCMYANTYVMEEDVKIYEYDRTTNTYIPFTKENENLYKKILQEATGIVHMSSVEE